MLLLMRLEGNNIIREDELIMSNSPLVCYTKISPNRNSPRNHKIDTITIHCMAGNMSIESCGNCFYPTSRKASSNYGIGSDGRIGMYVEEKDRSWCTSSASNDNRAITIEVANDGGESTGWHVSYEAYKSLIDLCVDICRRNGIKGLKWKGDKSLIGQVDKQNMTVHRWFANKSCPGDYLYNLHGKIAAEVNARLGVKESTTEESMKKEETNAVPFKVKVIVSDLNYRSKPSMNGEVLGQTGKGIFTIVEVSNGWGKLKSGAGWIYLENPKYCVKY